MVKQNASVEKKKRIIYQLLLSLYSIHILEKEHCGADY